MAYLDYLGLSYFKSLLDETYLRTSYTGDTTIAGDVTFTGDTVFSEDITGNIDGKAKKDWKGQQIDSTYIKGISTNNNAGQIVYTKGDGTSDYIMIDIMQGATASAVGKAGLVPAPTISERTKFLRGDGEWSVPTDIYVTQNLINTNDSFPILIGATAGATQSQVGTAIAFGTKVSVNPNTHTLIADHLILKHPTYRRSNNISSKVMYTLNFADSDDGNGNNLSEIYGYIDPVANGGEHELGFRLFGNPNVQGVEEIFTYLSVGLSKTNIPYGHAPSTPLPADHNEPTDIITRDWLARNGSETGLVHTTMNETIDGAKTFKKTVTINSGDNNNKAGLTVQGNASISGNSTVAGNSSISGNETVGGTLTSTGKLTANGTAEIKGGSGNTPSLLVTGNETVTGKLTGTGTAEFSGGSGNTPTLTVNGNESVSGNSSVGGNSSITGNETVGGNISTTNGNISTTNGTVSGKTGSIGTGGLTVAGNETVSGKITGNNGAEISGGNGLVINGNETVNGEIYKVVNNTPQEYVSYITNQQETKTTIINNLIDSDQGLKLITKGSGANAKDYIAFKIGNGLAFHTANDSSGIKGQVDVDFSQLPRQAITDIITGMVAPGSGLVADSSTGKLAVDFSQMPTDKFEHMLSALHLPLWVGENGIGTNFYVDISTGVDTTENGYGRSADKPWKTIAYATLTLAKNYNINTRNVIINVSGGTYTDAVSLPLLQRTTGSVYIRPKTADDIVNIEWTCVSSGASTISHSGGSWVIDNCNIKIILAEQTTPYYHYPHLVWSTDSTGGVSLRSCNFSFVDNTVPVDSTHGLCEARLICASSGNIQISNDGFYGDHSTAAGRTTTWSGTKTNANILWIHGEFGGNVTLWNGGQDYNIPYTFEVSGKWTRFVNLLSKSQITSNGVGPHAVFSYDIAQIGRGSQGYYISGGASASTGTSSMEDRENYFPRGYTTEEGSTTPVANFCNTSMFSYISPTN